MAYKKGSFAIPAAATNPVTVPFNYVFGSAPQVVLVSISSSEPNPVNVSAVVGTIAASNFEVTLFAFPGTAGYTLSWVAGDESDLMATLNPQAVPTNTNYLTIQEIRMFMLDRSAEDNALDLDLSFSDEEIVSAMKRAAREYNSIPPFVSKVHENRLPNDTNVFLHASAEQLYVSELSRAIRSDMDYTAGNVSVNIEKKRIDHFKDMIKYHRGEWKETATKIKVAANLAKAYRTF